MTKRKPTKPKAGRRHIFAAVVFAALGSFMIIRSMAATNIVTKEAEAGVLVGNARAESDAGTSGGQAVSFGGGQTPLPQTGVCPAAGSEQPIPTADTGSFKLIFADDFCQDSAVGSWGSECESSKVVYTGKGPLGATKWTAYPKCFLDTYQKRPYRSDAVLSTHDGVLDFYLHPVDGKPAGANPSPLIDGVSKYQTYGRYAARFKVDTPGLSDYHIAWLLWPDGDSKGACAESDYPEGDAAGSVSAFHHNDPGCSSYSVQDHYNAGVTFSSGWHTYVQEWEPGKRRYYVDGRMIGESTTRVWAGPERWQLQSETSTDSPNNKSGHLIVDWTAVWKYQP